MKDKSENPGFFFTLQEAASILRVSTRSLIRSIESGELHGSKVKGKWLLTRKSIFAYGLGFGPRLNSIQKHELEQLTG